MAATSLVTATVLAFSRLAAGATVSPRSDPVLLRIVKPVETPRYSQARQTTPADNAIVTCFNCYKTRHYASSCPEPRTTDLKEIQEEVLVEDDE